MQPVYIVQVSSGSSPFKPTNWHCTPLSIGVSVVGNSTTAWTLDYTVDDPTGSFPNPTLGSSGVTVYSTTNGNSAGGVYAAFTTPVAAIRLTVTSLSSAGSKVTATILQAGIG